MAICDYCNQEMLLAPGCSVKVLHLDGVAMPLPAYGAETGYGRRATPTRRCGDCNVLPGEAHHLGCDMAECPRCRSQLLSCGCRFDEDPPDEDEEDDDEWVACRCPRSTAAGWLSDSGKSATALGTLGYIKIY